MFNVLKLPAISRKNCELFFVCILGWIIDKDQSQWKLLGSVDPQKPQFFRPLTNKKGQTITKKLNPKDILAVRCGFINSTPNTVVTGGSRKDEMCALYVLYYSTKVSNGKSYCIGGQVLLK